MNLRIVPIACVAALTLPIAPGRAQELPHRIAVTRDGGPRLERGSVHGYNDVRYQVFADATGVLRIEMKGTLGSNLFNVYAPGTQPGKDEALFSGALSGAKAEVPISKAGDYLIQVFLMRNAARRGASSRYTLSVELTKWLS